MLRKTIKAQVSRTGLGISTGEQVTLTLAPAEARHGLRVKRTDVGVEIPLDIEHAAEAPNCTAVRLGEHSVFVVEHLLAALWAAGITDLAVSVDHDELPIFDGSARPLVEMVAEAGTQDLDGEVEPLAVGEAVAFGDEVKLLTALPAEELSIHYFLDHPHPLIGLDYAVYAPAREAFAARLAGARTFVTEDEARQLMASGWLQAGDEHNAVIVYPDRLSEQVEHGAFAAHKIVDLLGDLYLLNRPVLAQFMAFGTGHAENRALARELARRAASAT